LPVSARWSCILRSRENTVYQGHRDNFLDGCTNLWLAVQSDIRTDIRSGKQGVTGNDVNAGGMLHHLSGEFLQTLHLPKAQHRPFSSSKRPLLVVC
jgi:hypothetical protein